MTTALEEHEGHRRHRVPARHDVRTSAHPETGDEYLHAKAIDDFKTLYPEFHGVPRVMTLKPEPWMNLRPGQEVWESRWYFGWLQIAGFNTTNLKGVFTGGKAPEMALDLEGLLKKAPLTDAMLQKVSGDSELTLKRAARLGRLYALDMTMLDGVPTGSLHGDQRYVTAPIALFYWNPEASPGYPAGRSGLPNGGDSARSETRSGKDPGLPSGRRSGQVETREVFRHERSRGAARDGGSPRRLPPRDKP